MDTQISQLQLELNFKQLSWKQKETSVREYSTILDEAEKAYHKIVSNSYLLTQAIETESAQLKDRIRYKTKFQDKSI